MAIVPLDWCLIVRAVVVIKLCPSKSGWAHSFSLVMVDTGIVMSAGLTLYPLKMLWHG